MAKGGREGIEGKGNGIVLEMVASFLSYLLDQMGQMVYFYLGMVLLLLLYVAASIQDGLNLFFMPLISHQ